MIDQVCTGKSSMKSKFHWPANATWAIKTAKTTDRNVHMRAISPDLNVDRHNYGLPYQHLFLFSRSLGSKIVK